MTKCCDIKPFDVIRVSLDCYQVVLAVEPDMSLGGDNDTYVFYVLEQGQHKKLRFDPSEMFEVYAVANLSW